jgi:hypothetical protein
MARMRTVGSQCSNEEKRFAKATRSLGMKDVPGNHIDMKSMPSSGHPVIQSIP